MHLPFFHRSTQSEPSEYTESTSAYDDLKGFLSIVKTDGQLKVYGDGADIPISSLPHYYQLKASLLEEGQTTVIPNTENIVYKSAHARAETKPSKILDVTILFGEFRIASISMHHNILILLRIGVWKKEGENFHRTEQLPFFSRVPDAEVFQVFEEIINEIFTDASARKHWYQLTKKLLDAPTVKDLQRTLWDSVQAANLHSSEQAKEIIAKGNLDSSPPTAPVHSAATIKFFNVRSLDSPDRLEISWKDDIGQSFLQALISVGDVLRHKEQDPDFETNMVFYVGQYLLSQGQAPFNPYRSRFLGTPGFRAVTQTYLSLTDPGEGHIFATTRKERWLKGAIIHSEHLERPIGFTRQQIESYRFPSIQDYARIRLYTGYAAPSTIYVGRALQDDGDFYLDFIKVVNTTSSASTTAFSLGAAECKISMSRLTSRQMIAYMRALSGHALRNYRQFFSAAYNINDPFFDDLTHGNPLISVKKEIGLRGIELAALGGFNKVTFDGASDTYPSESIMIQLPFPDAIELIHKAHSAGLVTYFSAGFKLDTIPLAIHTGVDGIGVGGAQVLRIMDHKTGMHGPYTEEKLDGIIATRDKAAAEPRGQIAFLLARLDQMYFEGTITKEEMALRDDTYATALTKDEAKIKTLLSTTIAKAVIALPCDFEEPWKGRAHRLLRKTGEPLLKTFANEIHDGLWTKFVAGLNTILAATTKVPDVEGAVHSYSLSEPWKTLRVHYRTGLQKHYPKDLPKYFAGEIDINLKIEPITPPENNDPNVGSANILHRAFEKHSTAQIHQALVDAGGDREKAALDFLQKPHDSPKDS